MNIFKKLLKRMQDSDVKFPESANVRKHNVDNIEDHGIKAAILSLYILYMLDYSEDMDFKAFHSAKELISVDTEADLVIAANIVSKMNRVDKKRKIYENDRS